MKVSFITTVFNEEKTIKRFLDSLNSQTILPDEILIVDGESNDDTFQLLSEYRYKISSKNVTVIKKRGNRAVGRNEAINRASGDIIVCSDAGNILDNNWIKNIIKPFSDKKVDVVAGYYKGKTKTVFQKCLLPYAFVMPDKINPQAFLPATRSIAFTKEIWKRVKGFDEQYAHNEDYVFAKKLEEIGAKIVFAKDAIVYWLPRNTVKEAFVMFFRFAFGDAEARILRTKVILLFLRYAIFIYISMFAIITKSLFSFVFLSLGIFAYIFWSIAKNYKYVKEKEAFFWLPILQITADAAVLSGTILGSIRMFKTLSFKASVFSKPWLTILICLYVITCLLQIDWGIPNPAHPFAYNMDEWHGMQSIRSAFTIGTTNVAGAAYGGIFFYFTTGLFLIPFALLHIIDPFAIKSSVDNLSAQQHLFEILRLNTLLYGVGAIYLTAKVIKKFFKGNVLFTSALIIFTPIFLLLSGYYKYDVAVTFWILLSLFFMLRYASLPNLNNFIIAGIVSSLAVSIKISALPLLPIYFVSFFMFANNPLKHKKDLFIGFALSLITLLFFGFPDIITSWKGYYDLLHLNLVTIPKQSSNLILGGSDHVFLATEEFPATFGYFLYFSFLGSLLYWIGKIATIKKRSFPKKELFLFVCLGLFVLSIIPLNVGGGGNRSLVLLPFFVLIVSMTASYLLKNTGTVRRYSLVAFLGIGLVLQVMQSYALFSVKLFPDPRQTASRWIETNISRGTTIGVENIPIYQMLPDTIVNEFYKKQYHSPTQTKYNYMIVDAQTKKLPPTIVITNSEHLQYMKKSPTKDLIARLNKEHYKVVSEFVPDVRYYQYVGNSKIFIFSSLVNAPTSIKIYFQPTKR